MMVAGRYTVSVTIQLQQAPLVAFQIAGMVYSWVYSNRSKLHHIAFITQYWKHLVHLWGYHGFWPLIITSTDGMALSARSWQSIKLNYGSFNFSTAHWMQRAWQSPGGPEKVKRLFMLANIINNGLKYFNKILGSWLILWQINLFNKTLSWMNPEKVLDALGPSELIWVRILLRSIWLKILWLAIIQFSFHC